MGIIESIDELCTFYGDSKEGGICRLRGIGKKTFEELTKFLEEHGRTWKVRDVQ